MGRVTYVCTTCSQHFTGKYSAKRHNITAAHRGEIVTLVEYLMGFFTLWGNGGSYLIPLSIGPQLIALSLTIKSLDYDNRYKDADITGFIAFENLTRIGFAIVVVATVFVVMAIIAFQSPKTISFAHISVSVAVFMEWGGLILFIPSFLPAPRLKEFRFYFAKTYITAMSQETEIFQKIKYLVNGLNQYNKYLLNKSKLKINNVNQIVSKIMADSVINRCTSINKISDSFKKDGNKLEPIYLLKELLTNTNPEQFLVKSSVQLGANILTWGALIVSVISAAAAVLSIPALQWLWSHKISF